MSMSSTQKDRKCTCAHNIQPGEQLNPFNKTFSPSKGKDETKPNNTDGFYLVDDYVHLPNSSDNIKTKSNWNGKDEYSSFQEIGDDVGPGTSNEYRHAGFLDLVQHTSTLVQLGEGDFSCWESPLCHSCVERVAYSVQENTKHILNECNAYVTTVKSEEDKVCRIKAIHSTLLTSQLMPTTTSTHGTGVLHSHPPLTEIQSLENECQALTQEIETITTAIHNEQEKKKQLNEKEDTIFHSLNSLELSNLTYRDTIKKLALEYKSSQDELDLLNDVSLYSLLFHIDENVSSKAGRYDMINGLRFGFRPRKDLGWKEINAAWSLAAQLLFFVGETINYSWKELRIVPLTTCAKIIEINHTTKIVHHLGKELNDGTHHRSSSNNDVEGITPQAIISFNNLLYSLVAKTYEVYQDIIQHDSNALSCITKLSLYPMEKNKIDVYDLCSLKSDDSTWSAVIHCMVVNMKWVAECSTSCITYEFGRFVPFFK